MNFTESIKTCLSKYADFSGRAARSEYWWFMLACVLYGIVCMAINETFGNIATLAIALPSLAVSARRLHDIDRTGWWQLIGLVPLIGSLVLIYFYVQPSQPDANRFGAPPQS